MDNPEHTNKKSRNDSMQLATEIQMVSDYVRGNEFNQVQMIADHREEKFFLETQENMKLHNVSCNFVKQPGNIYHLYQRQTGQCYFSMLTPEDWGNSGPHQIYKGSFRLEHDQSWTRTHYNHVEYGVTNQILQSDEFSSMATLQNIMCVDS
ncbi:uncharacterized protein C1orf50 homolog isoform X2 [Belonocnema kinseyi]|nr:uncharacterized protein C1orf50 homolog isoform X2 [Belonocnema kinseyi]